MTDYQSLPRAQSLPRSSELLIRAIMARDPEHNPFYFRRDLNGDGIPETMCNFLVRDLCGDLGAAIPNARANDMLAWIDSPLGRLEGWKRASFESAKLAAGRGEVVIVGWVNPKGHPGHVAIMRDEKGHIAQAGRQNFNSDTITKGFGGLPVVYFTHP